MLASTAVFLNTLASTEDVTFVTHTPLCTRSDTLRRGRCDAGGLAGWSTGLIMAVGRAGQGFGEKTKNEREVNKQYQTSEQ